MEHPYFSSQANYMPPTHFCCSGMPQNACGTVHSVWLSSNHDVFIKPMKAQVMVGLWPTPMVFPGFLFCFHAIHPINREDCQSYLLNSPKNLIFFTTSTSYSTLKKLQLQIIEDSRKTTGMATGFQRRLLMHLKIGDKFRLRSLIQSKIALIASCILSCSCH